MAQAAATGMVQVAATAATAAAASGMPLKLEACTGGANQAFHLEQVDPYVVSAAVAAMGTDGNPPFCFDIEGYGTAAGSTVRAWPCGIWSKVNEYWKLDPAAGTVASLQPPPAAA